MSVGRNLVRRIQNQLTNTARLAAMRTAESSGGTRRPSAPQPHFQCLYPPDAQSIQTLNLSIREEYTMFHFICHGLIFLECCCLLPFIFDALTDQTLNPSENFNDNAVVLPSILPRTSPLKFARR